MTKWHGRTPPHLTRYEVRSMGGLVMNKATVFSLDDARKTVATLGPGVYEIVEVSEHVIEKHSIAREER